MNQQKKNIHDFSPNEMCVQFLAVTMLAYNTPTPRELCSY